MTEASDSVLRINGPPIAAVTVAELDAHFAVIAATQRKRDLGTDCHITRAIDRAECTGAASKPSAIARRLRRLGK